VKLSEVLTESAVLLDPQAGDKWQLIELLTDSLVASGQIEADSRDPVHEALLGRERSMSTGMEHGLAIPHTSVDQVDKTAVALGICRAGIDF
jgi:mannitol/fructose-specific phosphotransferase system IIA component (Ntr-type)